MTILPTRNPIPAVCLGAFVGAAPCLAGEATFQLLTTAEAADVTVDEFGRTLVLTTEGYGNGVFVYEGGSYSFVGSGVGYGLSADGNSVAGSIIDPEGVTEAARGDATGGWLPLGSVGQCDNTRSGGWDVSADGSTVVGLTMEVGGCNALGFVWTQATGLQTLEELANGNNRASVVAEDGEVIAGFAQGTFNRSPAAWLASTGMAHPTFPFDPDAQGEIGAMSSDGSILAGRYFDDTLSGGFLLPFYWTENDGIVVLPEVPDFPGGFVHDVSDDKRTFVGTAGTPTTGITAAIWRPEWGAVDLKSKLIELGANVPENYDVLFALGLSNDGQTVVGTGFLAPDMPNEPGAVRAFIATLPPAETQPCPPDLTGDGAVGFGDLTQLLSAWGPCPGCDEDLDDNDQVGFSDLTIMLNAWGPCP